MGSNVNVVCVHPAVLAAFAEENVSHREHILNYNKFTVTKSDMVPHACYATNIWVVRESEIQGCLASKTPVYI